MEVAEGVIVYVSEGAAVLHGCLLSGGGVRQHPSISADPKRRNFVANTETSAEKSLRLPFAAGEAFRNVQCVTSCRFDRAGDPQAVGAVFPQVKLLHELLQNAIDFRFDLIVGVELLGAHVNEQLSREIGDFSRLGEFV
jgi:hypothetical protein